MVENSRHDGIEIVTFHTDRINAHNVDLIRPRILKLFETPNTRVVLNLGTVNYLDSTGFSMFLHLLRVARSNYCTFRLCCLTPPAMELFELLQLHTAMEIYPDLESCLQSYNRFSPPSH